MQWAYVLNKIVHKECKGGSGQNPRMPTKFKDKREDECREMVRR
jgi:hypothetical protein